MHQELVEAGCDEKPQVQLRIRIAQQIGEIRSAGLVISGEFESTLRVRSPFLAQRDEIGDPRSDLALK